MNILSHTDKLSVWIYDFIIYYFNIKTKCIMLTSYLWQCVVGSNVIAGSELIAVNMNNTVARECMKRCHRVELGRKNRADAKEVR